AAVRAQHTRDQVEHGGLPRAVRPDHAQRLSGRDVEGETVDDDEPAEALGQTADLQQRGRAGHGSGSTVPPAGIPGYSLLETMTRLYVNFPVVSFRHWPPVSGVLATLGTGPLVQSRGPTIVETLSVDSAVATFCLSVPPAAFSA